MLASVNYIQGHCLVSFSWLETQIWIQCSMAYLEKKRDLELWISLKAQMTRGMQPVFYRNFKWNITYKNFESLCCTPETKVSKIFLGGWFLCIFKIIVRLEEPKESISKFSQIILLVSVYFKWRMKENAYNIILLKVFFVTILFTHWHAQEFFIQLMLIDFARLLSQIL